MSKTSVCLQRCASILLGGSMLVMGTARGQATADSSGKSSGASILQDYKIGSGDVLAVAVTDAPEFGGKYRVTDSGVIEIPGVSAPIRAEDQSTAELAQAIREALVAAGQLRDPLVSVYVDEFHGRTVTVLGAVSKPAVYPVAKRTNVLEALSLAGGALPNSGNTVTIVRGQASAEATGTPVGSVQIVRLSDLLSGRDSAALAEVRNGDVVSVSATQVIYVVGAVTKPGGYPMSDPSSGVSVAQAVALAEGLKGVASHHALIVRQSTSDHGRVEIPVDVGQMLDGKTTDVQLAPNDILFIPTSGTKETLRALGQVALSAASGAVFYGVGYQVTGVRP